ncbi:protein complex assembly-related protein [Gigaspora margarita]|uniref:Protein complex assembly-related protein n=1 Tax=Gigaspora margarita TaxID=4874 RepID=A0A8H4A6G3_GIGMA|nr:protein complex assembly-related protein [Gigaspora margarita]
MPKGNYWEAVRILDEEIINSISYYFVQWKGVDQNGDPWKPSWEPETNCTQALIEDWRNVKNSKEIVIKNTRQVCRRSSVASSMTISSDDESKALEQILMNEIYEGQSQNCNNITSNLSPIDPETTSETSTIIGDDETSNPQPNREAQNTSNVFASIKLISPTTKRPMSDNENFVEKDENNFSVKKLRTDKLSRDYESIDELEKQFFSSKQSKTALETPPPTTPSSVKDHLSDSESIISDSENELDKTENRKINCLATTHSQDTNSNDLPYLINQTSVRNEAIATLLQEREYYHKTVMRFENDWKNQQAKNEKLTQENNQTQKELHDKQIELSNARLQLQQLQEQLTCMEESCNKKDEKARNLELEWEDIKKQFDFRHKNDQEQIDKLQKTKDLLTEENQKLTSEIENLKVAINNASQNFSINRHSTRSSGNVKTLRVENDKLRSQIKMMSLKCELQQQSTKIIEEAAIRHESTVRFLLKQMNME